MRAKLLSVCIIWWFMSGPAAWLRRTMGKWQALCNFLKYGPRKQYEQPLYTEHCRPEPEEIVEPIPERCDHCNGFKRGYQCCLCGIWMKDIEPVETRGREVIINPIAMEYGERYRYLHMGSIWCAIRHRDESVEMYDEGPSWFFPLPPCDESVEISKDDRVWDSRTLRVEDCRKTHGWLSPELECGITADPRCEFHRKLYWGLIG